MRKFRLCVTVRHPDGMLEAPVYEEQITARDPADAVALAKAIELDVTGLRANAMYLVDANGTVVWSLQIADAQPGSV